MRKTRINPISKKQRKQLRGEEKLTQELLKRCKGFCEICGQKPDGRGLRKHEIVFRSQGGDPLDPNNCVMACGACHSVTGHNLRESDPAEDARQSNEDQQGLIRREGWGGIRRNRAEQCPTCDFVDIVGTCKLSVLPKRKCDFYRKGGKP